MSPQLSPFHSEKEMQQWLFKELTDGGSIGELLAPNSDDLSRLIPTTKVEEAIVASYSKCLASLWSTKVISADRNISISGRESLKPDFVLFACETESIVIVELKNISGPSRQAGTELGAYSGEIRTAMPHLSDADIVHVLISPVWPTLLCHYLFHEIFCHRRNVACLQPVVSTDGRIELEWVPPRTFSTNSNRQSVSPHHLGGYQVCLYDEELQEGSSNRHRLDTHIQQMKTSLQILAATGNAHNGNGFAFLWRDCWAQTLAPYSITVLNLSPFYSVEQHQSLDEHSPPFLIEQLLRIALDDSPTGHSNAIDEVIERGLEMLKSFCEPRCEGYFDWNSHLEIIRLRADLLAFSSWGIFRDSFTTLLKSRYQSGDIWIPYDCPDLGMEVVNDIVVDTSLFT